MGGRFPLHLAVGMVSFVTPPLLSCGVPVGTRERRLRDSEREPAEDAMASNRVGADACGVEGWRTAYLPMLVKIDRSGDQPAVTPR